MPSTLIQLGDGYISNVESPIVQLRYVNKSGDDATADGSIAKPYLTVKAALDSITDASDSKIYQLVIGPGVYTEDPSVRLKSWVYMSGAGSSTYLNTSNSTPVKWEPAVEYDVIEINNMQFGNGLSAIADASIYEPLLRMSRVAVFSSFTARGGAADYGIMELDLWGCSFSSLTAQFDACVGLMRFCQMTASNHTAVTSGGTNPDTGLTLFACRHTTMNIYGIAVSRQFCQHSGGNPRFRLDGAGAGIAVQGLGTNILFANITADLTNGNTNITGVSGATLQVGNPVIYPSIPVNTYVTAVVGGGTYTLSAAPTATVSAAKARAMTGVILQNGALTSGVTFDANTIKGTSYSPRTSTDWPNEVPAYVDQALDLLGARISSAITDIASPSTATAEDCANKINELLAALRSSNQLKT